MSSRFEVIVIGGGHAGVEAAWACANFFATQRGSSEAARGTVALVTLDPSKIGVMSCNPAIGGLAKGQIVREVDALGGLMALATDATGIMFKVLNTSKGPAVRGPRAQCDKHAYAEAVQALIAARPEIVVVGGSVEEIVVEGGRVAGVVVRGAEKGQMANGQSAKTDGGVGGSIWPFGHLNFGHLRAPAAVLTTGTFMRGLMHRGEQQTPGGRIGEDAAVGISAALRDMGFELGRLKTGTPPRLRRASIDWDALEPQRGDEPAVPFSDLTGVGQELGTEYGEWGVVLPHHDPTHAIPRSTFPALPQVECRITATTPEAHAAIRANIHRAPMYNGQIESAGPRYCPSIEDKVVRFADRESHHVFLEPESLRDDSIYCNGISTSLPADVQDAIVRSMPGCERAEVLRYGYAVEYDMVRPHQIDATCMTKLVEGLFLVGQINGTSGYEEAAGQGVVAGLNAARYASGQPLVTLGREQAYIGVMMDDLVTKTPVEPYRMFTSRAEHRLLLRSDNAADRLTPLARDWGLLDSRSPRWRRFERRRGEIEAIERIIDTAKVDGVALSELVKRPEFTEKDLARTVEGRQVPCEPEAQAKDGALSMNPFARASGSQDAAATHRAFSPPAIATVLAERQYAGYIVRQRAEARRHREMEHRRIPHDLDYQAVAGLRSEARLALARFRPATFGQAGRLEGVSPADLSLVMVAMRRRSQSAL